MTTIINKDIEIFLLGIDAMTDLTDSFEGKCVDDIAANIWFKDDFEWIGDLEYSADSLCALRGEQVDLTSLLSKLLIE